MITQYSNIRNSNRRSYKIYIYQTLPVDYMRDIKTHKVRGRNWQQRRHLRYTGCPMGVGQKLNGERVNFQALLTGSPR